MTQKPPELPSGVPQTPQPRTKLGKKTQKVLTSVWESLDQVGQGLMGELWRTVYQSVQDAIALGVLL
jgi:hypothetical protein